MTASKDGASSFTNISVEEHFSVSQSSSGGQVIINTSYIKWLK